ncbi:hypothetical protein ACEPAF_8527 [Sanghuangporus sanghuang]|uniref:Translocon-associated protein subunit alpha n=1 Tax=Sanghuangporus baumii TaxID=108892 RepID=A0A9Q5HSX0_SANBA|nr:hypothetical protein A7U60_g7579 [Sanghuangporus baumii]
MRFFTPWSALLFLVVSIVSQSDQPASTEPEISVIASFPENNPFGQIVNGERNRINLLIENQSEQNVTLISVAGSFHDPQTDSLIKNASTLPYGLRLVSGAKVQLPYQFHSEFKPGDIRLKIWLTHAVDDNIYRVTAYDSVVTVVEPDFSFFDYQVITTYLLTAAFLGGLGYLAYTTFVPKPRKSRKTAVSTVSKAGISSPVGSVTASGAGYEEEWIPEHHLKMRGGKKKAGAASSGDELSGGETSGTEGRKRKGRK